MEVKLVAQTVLSIDPATDDYAIKATGYRLSRNQRSTFDMAHWVEDIDELHEAAGRLCYKSECRPNPVTATNQTYLLHSIIDNCHFSVMEHANLTFYMKGLTRNLLLELERHRFLSYSVISTRYVDMSRADNVIPPAFADLDEEDRVFLTVGFDNLHASALDIYAETFKRMMSPKYESRFSKKEAREAAREALLGSVETEYLVTANIRTWREIVQKRGAPGAAREIRDMAKLILPTLQRVAPNSTQDLEIFE